MLNDDNYEYIFKIIIIGNSNVGKTSLIHRFIDNKYNEKHLATLGCNFHMKTISINEKIIKIQIWDTAGMEKYQSITKSYYRGAQACLIVFDITNRESFDSIGNWIENFNNFSNPNIEKIIILIGNKCDLGIDRKITYEEAENYSRGNNLFYYETSAKDNINIHEVFQFLGSKLLKINYGNKTNIINHENQGNNLDNYTKIICPEINKKQNCCLK
jgi:Ras-related protein Rab-1A